MMNIKKICTFFAIMLLSFDALSVGFFTIKLDHLTVTNSDQRAPKGSVLGYGWKVYTPKSNETMCESWEPANYTYTANNEGADSGVSIYNDSAMYPVFKTNVDGIGYVMSVRQLGTSMWHPAAAGNSSTINTEPNTKSLDLELKFAYVKTKDGSIDIKPNWYISIVNTRIFCEGEPNGFASPIGYIRFNGGTPDMDNRTCDVRTPTRQTVNLGIHNLSDIKPLKIGETFGSAQQQVTIDCPNKMTVYYSVTDNNNPGYVGGDIILLENESEKPGFGVKMYEAGNSTALIMGGDKDFSAQYQYLFVKTDNTDEVATKTFDFKYVKTSNEVKAVDGNAQVTLTLMYK